MHGRQAEVTANEQINRDTRAVKRVADMSRITSWKSGFVRAGCLRLPICTL